MKEIRFISDTAKEFKMTPDEELVQITESWYYTFLNNIPPVLAGGHWFLVGEPFGQVEISGQTYMTYVLCFRWEDKYYAAQPVPLSFSGTEGYIEHVNHLIQKYLISAQ